MTSFLTKIICSISLFLLPILGFSQTVLPTFQADEIIVSILKQDRQLLLVTNQRIYQQHKNVWQLWLPAPLAIRTAIVAQNRLWVGGREGLYWWDALAKNWQRWKGLRNGNWPVNTLNVNPVTGDLLVATATDGAFILHDTILLRTLVGNTETQTVCTCGPYQWIGTPAGLLRLDHDGNIQKYAEEGVMGFEIPDNIVESLFCSQTQVLTVASPEPLAFFPIPASGAPAHGAHFDYLGGTGNTVFSQVELPGGDYLFLTAQGLLRLSTAFLGDHHETMGSVEVHDDRHNPKAVVVPVSRFTLDPMLQKEVWKKGFWDKKGNLWLTSDRQLLRIKKRQLG